MTADFVPGGPAVARALTPALQMFDA